VSATVTPLRREGGPLTREQRALVKSVPGIAERAAREVAHEIGGDPKDMDRINQAHLGIFRAAQTYDPGQGTFAQWALFLGVCEILDAERKGRKAARLLSAARIAGIRCLAERQHRPDDISPEASDQDLREALVGLAREELAAKILGALVAEQTVAQGEEELAERITWRRVVDALQQVLEGLQPEHREMLLLFAHGHTIKSIAKARRVDYWTLLERFHAQLALVAARLRGQHVEGAPPRPAGALEALPEPALPPSEAP
jgi:hypothetical protein